MSVQFIFASGNPGILADQVQFAVPINSSGYILGTNILYCSGTPGQIKSQVAFYLPLDSQGNSLG